MKIFSFWRKKHLISSHFITCTYINSPISVDYLSKIYLKFDLQFLQSLLSFVMLQFVLKSMMLESKWLFHPYCGWYIFVIFTHEWAECDIWCIIYNISYIIYHVSYVIAFILRWPLFIESRIWIKLYCGYTYKLYLSESWKKIQACVLGW